MSMLPSLKTDNPRHRFRFAREALSAVMVITAAALLGGCSVPYYWQAVTGQVSLLNRRVPIEAAIEDPQTDAQTREALRTVLEVRRFAVDELGLPQNQSYSTYVDLSGGNVGPEPGEAGSAGGNAGSGAGRRRVNNSLVWSVVAAEEFSIDPRTWCFPFAGCVSYRGYFNEDAARRYAAQLQGEGMDVAVGGATAYSTLGWFDDPILSSFVHYDEAALADLIFHELAHSVVYVPGDSGFNEGFASFVGNRGAIAYLMANGGDAKEYGRRLEHANAYARFLLDWRGRLAGLYREPVADAAKRQLKAELLSAMREGYRRNLEDLGGGRYDAAMARPFNNARLALVGTYEDSKRDFEQLFNAVGGDWRAFYRAVKELAALPKEKRWE